MNMFTVTSATRPQDSLYLVGGGGEGGERGHTISTSYFLSLSGGGQREGPTYSGEAICI